MTISNAITSLTFSGKNTGSSTGQSLVASVNNGQNSIPDPSITWADGTGAGQFNNWHFGKYTITASGSTNFDLAGSKTDPFGTTLTFTKIKQIIAVIDYGTGSYDGSKVLRIGPGASNGFTGPFGGTTPYLEFDRFTVHCKGSSAGWTVTASTGDILNIANPGASDVDVYLWIAGVA